MTKQFCVILAMLAVMSLSGFAQSGPSIEGVWKITEQTINGRTLEGEKLGVGFHIYTKGYFAVVRESGEPPRRPVGEVTSKTTMAQIMAAWGPFVSQLGTYRVSGDQLIGTILVAKNPADGKREEGIQKFSLDGDILTLETTGVRQGRAIRLKFVRVE